MSYLKGLCCATVPHCGGAEKSLMETVLHTDIAWTLAVPDGELSQQSPCPCVRIPPLRLRKGLRGVLSLKQILAIVIVLHRHCRQNTYDILYANGFTAFVPLVILSFIHRVPIVVHIRDIPLPYWWYRFVVSRADKVIIPSLWMKKHFTFLTDRDQLCSIENAVDAKPFIPAQREKTDTVQSIGMLSQFVPWKGCSSFLEMAAVLAEKYPHLHFILQGGDPLGENKLYVQELHHLCMAPSLQGRIEIRPWQSATVDLYRDIDLLVMPSVGEPFGRVVVEAGLVGIPVVVVAGSGGEEIIDGGMGGYIARSNNPVDLAEAVERALANPQKTEKKKKHNYTKARQYYTPSRAIKAIGAVCSEVIQKKVYINTSLLRGSYSGVEHCIAELSESLQRINPTVVNIHSPRSYFAPRITRICWEHIVLPFLLWRKRGRAVLHSPGYIRPLYCPVPSVLTVHDCIALDNPELCSFANRIYYGIFLRWSIQNATVIVVPSTYVKKRLGERFDIEKKVRVIPWAVRDVFYRVQCDGVSREKPYLLHVGTAEPKKNIPFILDLLSVLPGYLLVLVGARGWGGDLKYEIERRGLEARVIVRGYISDEELAREYKGAHALLFPSLVEGFGLPIWEAMAVGTPVIASRGGALDEVVGDGGMLFDGWDTAVVAAMVVACGDPEKRRLLVEKGRSRVRAMSWDAVAEAYIRVYEEL